MYICLVLCWINSNIGLQYCSSYQLLPPHYHAWHQRLLKAPPTTAPGVEALSGLHLLRNNPNHLLLLLLLQPQPQPHPHPQNKMLLMFCIRAEKLQFFFRYWRETQVSIVLLAMLPMNSLLDVSPPFFLPSLFSHVYIFFLLYYYAHKVWNNLYKLIFVLCKSRMHAYLEEMIDRLLSQKNIFYFKVHFISF